MMILFPPCVSMTVSHAPLLKHCDILLIRLNSAKLKALYTWKHSKCFWSPSWFKQCIFSENPIDVISKSGLSQESPFSVWRTLWSSPKINEARSFFKKKTFVILTKLSELSKREDKNTEIENTTSFKCKQKERKIFSQNSSLYFSIATDTEMKMEENFNI